MALASAVLSVAPAESCVRNPRVSAGHPGLNVSESICPEIDQFQVDRGACDLSPKSGCPEIRISGPRRQSVARAYNFEDFGAGRLFGEGRWSETGSGTRRRWQPRRGLRAISSPVERPRVYRRISRFRRHLPGDKAGRGRSSGGDLPANWPILGRPAELHSAGHLGNPEIRTSGRGRVYGHSELRFSASPSAAFLGVPAKRRSRVSGTLAEPPGLRFYGAICSRVGRRRVDRRGCDFPRKGSGNPDVGFRTSGGNPLYRGTPSRCRVYDVVVGGFA